MFRNVLLWLVLSYFVQTSLCQPSPCGTSYVPRGCTCWENWGQKSINCQHENFESVPHNLYYYILASPMAKLERLDLSHNKISALESNDFPLSIVHVDLSHNKISKIEPGSFDAMKSTLKTLDLSFNRVTSAIYDFSELSSLSSFSVAHNKNIGNHRELVDNLPHGLKHLDISYTMRYGSHLVNKVDGGKLAQLESLTVGPRIFIEGDDARWSDDNNLKVLTLHGSSGLALSDYIKFEYTFHKLKELVITSGFILPCAISVFPHPKLTTLERLSITNSMLWSVPADCLSASIHSLDISHNEISNIKGSDFNVVKNSLQYLYLSHNNLDRIEKFYFKRLARKLKYLDLSHNALLTIEDESFSSLSKLVHLDISHNSLYTIGESTFSPQQLQPTTALKLFIDHNGLNCACDAKWIVDAIRSELVTGHGPFQSREIHQLTCAAPTRWSDTKFAELATRHYVEFRDNMQCG